MREYSNATVKEVNRMKRIIVLTALGVFMAVSLMFAQDKPTTYTLVVKGAM
jgi:hypothetical protein